MALTNKKLLLSIEGTTAENDFLKSDFFALAKNYFSQIIILSPANKLALYQKLYGGDNIIFEEAKEEKNTFLQDKFFNILRYSIHTKTARLRLMRTIFKQTGFQFNSWVLFILPCLASWQLSRFAFWRKFLRFLYNKSRSDKYCLEILRKHQPDVIYCDITPISVKDFNLKLIKAAKKLKIKTIGNIISWDQLTSKTFITTHTDYLTVHNEKIKEEAIRIGDFPGRVIEVCGIPRFDFYFRNDIYQERKEFFNEIGADPAKKLILFAGGLREFEIDYDYFFALFEKIAKEELLNCQFYLRPYPDLPFDEKLKEQYEKSPYLVFEKPNANFENLLANLFKHTEVLVCIYSTLMIEACLVDLPIINLSYFPNARYKKYYEPSRQLEKNHLASIFKNNCCLMAENNEQLVEQIKAYLANPSLKREERKKTALSQAGYLDGNAGSRVFEAVKKWA